jgi:hypothetical protein
VTARRRGIALVLFAGVMVGACGSTAPTVAAGRVLHIENLAVQAVAVSIASRGSSTPAYQTAVRPCGGSLDLTVGANGVPSKDLLITFLVDPTRNFDSHLAAWQGDPHDMPGDFSGLSIMWSTGEITPTDLPRWLLVTPAFTVENDASKPALVSPGACASPQAVPT